MVVGDLIPRREVPALLLCIPRDRRLKEKTAALDQEREALASRAEYKPNLSFITGNHAAVFVTTRFLMENASISVFDRILKTAAHEERLAGACFGVWGWYVGDRSKRTSHGVLAIGRGDFCMAAHTRRVTHEFHVRTSVAVRRDRVRAVYGRDPRALLCQQERRENHERDHDADECEPQPGMPGRCGCGTEWAIHMTVLCAGSTFGLAHDDEYRASRRAMRSLTVFAPIPAQGFNGRTRLRTLNSLKVVWRRVMPDWPNNKEATTGRTVVGRTEFIRNAGPCRLSLAHQGLKRSGVSRPAVRCSSAWRMRLRVGSAVGSLARLDDSPASSRTLNKSSRIAPPR